MHSDQPRRGWSVAVKLILAGWLLDALSFFFFPLIGYDIGAMIAQLFGVAPKIKISASFLDLFGFAVIIRSLVDLVDQIGGGMLGAPFQDVQATVKVGYGFLWTVLFLTLAGYGVFLFSLGRWSASAHQEAWPQNPGHMLNLTSFGVGILHFLYTLLLFWQQSASEGGITYLSFGAWFLFLAGIMLCGGTALHVSQSPQFSPYRARLKEAMQRHISSIGRGWSARRPEMYGSSWSSPRGLSAPPPPPPAPMDALGDEPAAGMETFASFASDTQIFVETEGEVQAWLETQEGRRLPLRLPQTSIGRLADNDLRLSHPSISKRHVSGGKPCF